MQYSSSLCLFLGLQAAAAAAVDGVQPRVAAPGGIEGYRTEPFVWDVPVFPGGENATISGTLEEVHAELVRRNPQWDSDFPLEAAAADSLAARGESLARRTDFRGARTVCGGGSFGWEKASTYEIKNGIDYLRRVGGNPPSQGPGPGSCGRVSCSWSSAIWWCNDARETKTLAAWGSIADGAAYVVEQCEDGRLGGGTVGQVFHSTNWNVIVRKDNC